MKNILLILSITALFFPSFSHAFGVDFYGDKTLPDIQLSEGERQVIDHTNALLESVGGSKLQVDLSLSEVAQLHSTEAEKKLQPDKAPMVNDKLIRSLMWKNGLIDHELFSIGERGPSIQSLLKMIDLGIANRVHRRGYNFIGVGIKESGTSTLVLTLLFVKRTVRIEPFPREVPLDSTQVLSGELLGESWFPRVIVTYPEGETEELKVKDDITGRGFSTTVLFTKGKGKYEVEIAGSDSLGPFVAGLFPVYAGESAQEEPLDTTEEQTASLYSTSEEAEKAMFDLINKDRQQMGLNLLRWNSEVANVAREHSRDMALNRFFGHVSPTRGTLEDRMALNPNISASIMLENVAMNKTVEDAEEGLMDSPGHRQNILNKDVTEVGVGIVIVLRKSGVKFFYVTQDFIKPVEKLDPAEASKKLYDYLNRKRRQASLLPLKLNTELSSFALEHSRYMLEKDKISENQTFSGDIPQVIESIVPEFTKASWNVYILSSFEDMETMDMENVQNKAFDTVGVGVIQGSSKEYGRNRFWATVIYIRSRR